MSRSNSDDGKECSQPPRTMHFVYNLELTLEEMFYGTKRHFLIPRNVVCGRCRGSGSKVPTNDSYDTCELCHGHGFRTKIQRTSADSSEVKQCELCWGEGVAITEEYRCEKCKGRKTVQNEIRVVCNIRPGTHEGDCIILKGKGQQVPNKRPGNIIVKMQMIAHETFQRSGDDLIVTRTLDLIDALGGYDNFVTTLDKRRLHICIPRGNVIINNQMRIFLGQGMPKYEQPGERGNLIIKFIVNLPDNIRAALAPKLENILPRRETVEIPIDAEEKNMVAMTPTEIVNRLADREVIKESRCDNEGCINGACGGMDFDAPTDYEHGGLEGQVYIRYEDSAFEQSFEENIKRDAQQNNYRVQPNDSDPHYQYNPYDEVYEGDHFNY